jgi:tetratricopeptide (TPR) repeat protein
MPPSTLPRDPVFNITIVNLMEQVPLFDAITILISVSVFSTGFLSVRIHANRDRLLERVDRIGEHLNDTSPSQGDQYNYGTGLIIEELERYKEASKPDSIALATAFGNFGVFLLTLILAALIIKANKWEFTTTPSKVVPEFWALSACGLVEFGIAVLGYIDLEFVYRDIAERLSKSFAMMVGNAVTATALGQFKEEIQLYSALVKNWPATHLSYFLRGRAYLALGDQAVTEKNFKIANEYYTKAHEDFVQSSERFASNTIFNFRSEASLKAKQYQSAVRESTKAITLDATNARAYLLRMDGRKALGAASEAAEDLTKATQLDSVFSESWRPLFSPEQTKPGEKP